MKNTLICLSIIILSLTLIKNKNQNEVIIPTDSIRFRVIASSDSELDIDTVAAIDTAAVDLAY